MFRRSLIGAGVVILVMMAVGAYAAGAFSNDQSGTPETAGPDGPGTSPQSPPAQDHKGMQRVPAPIDEAHIALADGTTEYRLIGTAGLPGGCAEPAGYDIDRDGHTINIDVHIFVPADNRPCTDIYKTYPLAIGLGTDLTSGVEYTVNVNDTTLTFTPSVSQGSK